MNKLNPVIKNPCHLKWKDLTKIEGSKDRHCSECSLNIVDFTKMNNEEIVSYLEKKKGTKVCGVMRTAPKKEETKTIGRTIGIWRNKVNSNIMNNYLKSVLLYSIGLLMIATGCSDDDRNDDLKDDPTNNFSGGHEECPEDEPCLEAVGDVQIAIEGIPPVESKIQVKKVTKYNDSIFTKRFKPKK